MRRDFFATVGDFLMVMASGGLGAWVWRVSGLVDFLGLLEGFFICAAMRLKYHPASRLGCGASNGMRGKTVSPLRGVAAEEIEDKSE